MDTTSTAVKHCKPIPPHIRHHLQKQPLSGKTITEYCRKAGFSSWTFYNWRKRYGNQLKESENGKTFPPSKPPLSFATIGTLHLQESRQPLFDIRFSTGTTVSVYGAITADQLSPFLSLISGGSASC
jgi:hypothetical protein